MKRTQRKQAKITVKRKTIKTKKKVEFSKLIFIGISTATAAVVVFSCVMMYRTGDLTPLAYLIPSVFTELATATGYYFWKAKRENEIKIPFYLKQGQNALSDGELPTYSSDTFTE